MYNTKEPQANGLQREMKHTILTAISAFYLVYLIHTNSGNGQEVVVYVNLSFNLMVVEVAWRSLEAAITCSSVTSLEDSPWGSFEDSGVDVTVIVPSIQWLLLQST
jgi:hypothetical protein